MAHETDDERDEFFEEEDPALPEDVANELWGRRGEFVKVMAELLAAHVSHHGEVPGDSIIRTKLLTDFGRAADEVLDMADSAFGEWTREAIAEQMLGEMLPDDEEDEGELP